MSLESLELLQIHEVRWLARGNVMKRLTKLMPGILTFWKDEAKSWYEKARIYKVQFFIHMLADVLHELNILNKKFQEESLDVTELGSSIDVTIGNLLRCFLREIFGEGTIYLSKFMEATREGTLQHINESGYVFAHELLFLPIPLKDINGNIIDTSDGSLNSCIEFCKGYVLKVVECLNERFPDSNFFNSIKLFSPKHYITTYVLLREITSTLLLERLLEKFGCIIVNIDGCKYELHSFVHTLHSGCEGMSMKEAWRVFSSTLHWQETYPNMMRLWQFALVLPTSSVACERGFSKQNLIKDARRRSLKIGTLDALMRVSLLGPSMESVDWSRVYHIWEEKKDRLVLDL